VGADPLLNLAFTPEYLAANQRIGSKFMPWSPGDGEDLPVPLDGYVADKDGNFDWAAPDTEVHTFVNDLEGEIGTKPAGTPDV
jgi:hypothetical protein